jgi:hypothetical protein
VGESFTVEYSSDLDEFRIVTPDSPDKALYTTLNDFLKTALWYFGTVDTATFSQVSLSGANDPVSRLEVEVYTNVGHTGTLKFPPVSRVPVFEKTGEILRDNAQNMYNAKLDLFLEQVGAYAAGKRSQQELVFDDEGDTPEAADRVLVFSR